MKVFKSVRASFFLIITSALITGCASVGSAPPVADSQGGTAARIVPSNIPIEAQQHQTKLASITDFQINGRMGVQTEGHGISGNIYWLHSKEYDAIDLYSPLGNKIATIVKNADGASLTAQNGKTIKASDAETLTARTLGWRLPLAKLSDWVVGRPANGIVSGFTWNDKGYLSKFNQDDWEISYMQYQSESEPALPSKINIRNPKMNVRIMIDSWDTSGQSPAMQDINTVQTP